MPINSQFIFAFKPNSVNSLKKDGSKGVGRQKDRFDCEQLFELIQGRDSNVAPEIRCTANLNLLLFNKNNS
jgi:hypothetical protein